MREGGDGLRRAVRRLHLWLGLSLGALFVLLGLTGSVLVFYPELDAMLHPEIRVEGGRAPDWDRALATLRAEWPEKGGPWRMENTGRPGAIPARYYDPPERAGHAFRPMMVWLSPDGARVLRRDYWGEYAVTFIYDLHYRLLLGTAGATVLGYAGLILLVLLVSGIWAWWPRGAWRKALRMKRRAAPSRRLYDWHKQAGLWSAALLFVLTLTGVMLELPEESDAVLARLGAPVDHRHEPAARFRPGAEQISPSQAVAIARARLPKARLAWIETPARDGGWYRLRMQQPSDPSRRFPHSFVTIDPFTGAIAAVVDADRAGPGTAVNNWVHPLHDGSAGGLGGRLLVFLAGLAPLALFVTGLLRWRARRRARQNALALGREMA